MPALHLLQHPSSGVAPLDLMEIVKATHVRLDGGCGPIRLLIAPFVWRGAKFPVKRRMPCEPRSGLRACGRSGRLKSHGGWQDLCFRRSCRRFGRPLSLPFALGHRQGMPNARLPPGQRRRSHARAHAQSHTHTHTRTAWTTHVDPSRKKHINNWPDSFLWRTSVSRGRSGRSHGWSHERRLSLVAF